MSSANGRGRTLFEILTGRNKRNMTPLELQYHNPLEARVDQTKITFEHLPRFQNVTFLVEGIFVYKTRIGRKDFFHTDYALKGASLKEDKPIRLRLRLIPDEDAANELRQQMQLLYLYDELPWDQGFHDNVLQHPSRTFEVNLDDQNQEMPEPWIYTRVGKAVDAYRAKVTHLQDTDRDGSVEDDELDHSDVAYWDYEREKLVDTVQTKEFLTVDMDCETRYFTIFRGSSIEPFQVSVF